MSEYESNAFTIDSPNHHNLLLSLNAPSINCCLFSSQRTATVNNGAPPSASTLTQIAADEVRNRATTVTDTVPASPLSSDSVEFVALARVFSGTVFPGQRLFVLGPKFDGSKVRPSPRWVISVSWHVCAHLAVANVAILRMASLW